ncbi:MAG: DHH family phosphoesterase [Brevinematales bacterium]|nr:DHH family phosphoesterase [Brevinematales bacterium]
MNSYRIDIIRKFLNDKNLLSSDFVELLDKMFEKLSDEDLYYTLNPYYSSFFSPFEFRDMPKAVDRIIKSIRKNENILIFGDKDADGVLATFMLKKFLEDLKKRLGSVSEIFYEVPEGNDVYGIMPEDVEDYYGKVSLIITVDNGISAVDAIRKAKKMGIDVIITDHHELHNKDIFDYAYAVINPKVDKKEGVYLSGTGVVFFLILGLLIYEEYGDVRLSFIFDVDDKIEIVDIINFVPRVRIFDTQEIKKYSSKKIFVFIDEKHLSRTLKIVPNLNEITYQFIYLRRICEKFNVKFSSLENLYERYMIPNFYVYGQRFSKLIFILHILGNTRIKSYIDNFSPIVGLSVLSDSMPFISYNRFFIKNAVERISKIEIDSIKYVVSKVMSDNAVTYRSLVMLLVPFINTPGRMGQTKRIIELLIEGDLKKIESLVSEISKLNDHRKKVVSEFMNVFSEKIKSERVFVGTDIDKGVISLISTRISSEVNYPIVVMSNGGNGDVFSGSARFNKGDVFSIIKMLSSHLENFGGHKKAAGFVIMKDKISDFIQEFMRIDYTKFYDKLIPLVRISINYFYKNYSRLLYSIEPMNEEYKPIIEDVVVIEDFRKLYNAYQVKIGGDWFNTTINEDSIREFVGKRVIIIYSYDIKFDVRLQKDIFIPKILEIKDA